MLEVLESLPCTVGIQGPSEAELHLLSELPPQWLGIRAECPLARGTMLILSWSPISMNPETQALLASCRTSYEPSSCLQSVPPLRANPCPANMVVIIMISAGTVNFHFGSSCKSPQSNEANKRQEHKLPSSHSRRDLNFGTVR